MLASSRGTLRRANACGRDKSRPYNQRRARGLPGNRCPCAIINLCRGRCLHRPGGLYAARTPAGGINPAPTNKFVLLTNRNGPVHPGGRRAGCPHPAAPRAAANPAGGYGIRPYNQRRARGQPGNRKLCVTSNPCRGRCSHRPGGPYAARMPVGGINPVPTNKFCVLDQPEWPRPPGRP